VIRCVAPLTLDSLVAWWTGELSEPEAARVEQHAFECDVCGRALENFAELAAALGEALPPVISHAQRDRLAEGGLRVRETRVEAGQDAHVIFERELDLLVHVLRADVAGAERVDVEVLLPNQPPIEWSGVPFQPGEVLICCQRHFAQVMPGDPTFRVYAQREGRREHVGDYFVAHQWET
jgi:hypothetical protein